MKKKDKWVLDMIQYGRECKDVSKGPSSLHLDGSRTGFSFGDLMAGIDVCHLSGKPVDREPDPLKVKVIESWADGKSRASFSPKQRETIDRYAQEVEPDFRKYENEKK